MLAVTCCPRNVNNLPQAYAGTVLQRPPLLEEQVYVMTVHVSVERSSKSIDIAW
jgi:hypothetical protein